MCVAKGRGRGRGITSRLALSQRKPRSEIILRAEMVKLYQFGEKEPKLGWFFSLNSPLPGLKTRENEWSGVVPFRGYWVTAPEPALRSER